YRNRVYPVEHVSEFIGARGRGTAGRYIRAGFLARCVEQDYWLVVPSKSFSSLCRA
ncbi:hypothetical protein A2U01_0114836, partial [Trifolium medium]|nr:hypothetical protein [Trifolium medium]